MRSTLTIFIICILFLPGICYSQFNPLEGLERTNPEKGLKRTEVIVIEDTSGKAPFVSATYLYNEDGYLLHSFYLNSYGDTVEKIYNYMLDPNTELTVYIAKDRIDTLIESYDSQNRAIKYIWLWDNDQSKDTVFYFYDKKGLLVREEEKYWRSRNLYKYKGNQVVSIRTIEDGNKEEEEDPENYISAKFQYSKDKLTITMIEFSYDHKPDRVTIRTINSKNLPVKEERYVYRNKTKELQMLDTWEYYENGKTKSSAVSWYESGIVKWSFHYNYNENGRVINSLHEDMIFKFKIYKEYKYEYY